MADSEEYGVGESHVNEQCVWFQRDRLEVCPFMSAFRAEMAR
jgi:hypothetical protein